MEKVIEQTYDRVRYVGNEVCEKVGKKETDWLLYLLLLGLLVTVVVFAVTSGIVGPQLDMVFQSNPDGTFTLTLTGISEIIVACAFAVGALYRFWHVRRTVRT